MVGGRHRSLINLFKTQSRWGQGGENIVKSFGHPKIFWYGTFGDVLPKKPYPPGQIWGTFWPNQIQLFLPIFGPFGSKQCTAVHWKKKQQLNTTIFTLLFLICMTSTRPRHLPYTLRHHQDTARHEHPQTPQYLAHGRPLGEKAIDKYHDIYFTVFNLYYIYPPQTSLRHAQTLSRRPQSRRPPNFFGPGI